MKACHYCSEGGRGYIQADTGLSSRIYGQSNVHPQALTEWLCSLMMLYCLEEHLLDSHKKGFILKRAQGKHYK